MDAPAIFCSKCKGALAPVRTSRLHRPHYECQCCGAVFVECGQFGVVLCEAPQSHVIRDNVVKPAPVIPRRARGHRGKKG
jgi:hypothetical protein